MKIYHNPRCSKSRQALALLQENHVECQVIEYLNNPPSYDELQDILSKLNLRPKNIIRTKEEQFQELDIDLENDEAVLLALVKNPKLLERPIIVNDTHGVIGRPPENVLRLI